jgi:hypothetical protein
MKAIRILTLGRLLAGALLMGSLFAAVAGAQSIVYQGKFTLPYEVRWSGSTLPAGDYSIKINSTGSPMIALIRSTSGKPAVTYVMNGSIDTDQKGQNALLITARNGKNIVHSLAVADLGVVLVYDPGLAHEKPSVEEAQAEHSVPLVSAKK